MKKWKRQGVQDQVRDNTGCAWESRGWDPGRPTPTALPLVHSALHVGNDPERKMPVDYQKNTYPGWEVHLNPIKRTEKFMSNT